MISARPNVRSTRPIFAVFHMRINTKRNGSNSVFAADGHDRREYVVPSSTHGKGVHNKKNGTRQTRVFIHLRIPKRNNFSSYIIIVQTPSYYKSLCGIPRARSRAFPYRYNTYVISYRCT